MGEVFPLNGSFHPGQLRFGKGLPRVVLLEPAVEFLEGLFQAGNILIHGSGRRAAGCGSSRNEDPRFLSLLQKGPGHFDF